MHEKNKPNACTLNSQMTGELFYSRQAGEEDLFMILFGNSYSFTVQMYIIKTV